MGKAKREWQGTDYVLGYGGIGLTPVTPIYCGVTIPDRQNFLPRGFRL
jgi:hypothetical protein